MTQEPTTDAPTPAGGPIYSTRAKVVIVAALTLAVGGFVLAGMRADTDNDDAITVSGVPAQAVDADGVEALVPRDGAEILAQQRIGIDLADGWVAELVLQPPSGPAIVLPPEQLETSALNEQIFQPGCPGDATCGPKVLDRLPAGRNCLRATVWNQIRGRDATERIESWCFDVT